MADKKPAAKKGAASPKSSMYEVKEGKISRKNQSCPRCGDGVFLANHADRLSCGKCGYTEYKKK
jgi:ubiquitin-small subunit ribosomal protein S27Ae